VSGSAEPVQKDSGRYPTALRHNAQQLAGMPHDGGRDRSATAAAGPRERKLPCAQHEGALPTAAQTKLTSPLQPRTSVDTTAQITQRLLEGLGGDRLELEDDRGGGGQIAQKRGRSDFHQHGRAPRGGAQLD